MSKLGYSYMQRQMLGQQRPMHMLSEMHKCSSPPHPFAPKALRGSRSFRAFSSPHRILISVRPLRSLLFLLTDFHLPALFPPLSTHLASLKCLLVL